MDAFRTLECRVRLKSVSEELIKSKQVAMDALYHSTNNVIQEIQRCFQQLNSPGVDAILVENEILTKMNSVNA